MRILYLAYAPIIGGAEISLLSHLKYIDKEKFDITLLCSDILYAKAKEIEGIKVIKMDFYLLYQLNPIILVNFMRMVLEVVKIVRSEKVDIIHTNSVKSHYIGLLASLITRKKLILWIRDDTMNKKIYFVAKFIPYKVIFVSKYLESIYGKRKNTLVIYNGSDIYKKKITEEEKNRIKEDLRLKDKIVILCNERLVYWKGVQVLIDALEAIKDKNFIALIIGTGNNQKHNIESILVESIEKKGLTGQVKFLGWRNDIYRYYQVADILVHPVIRPEPFGLVIIEAMSFGIPVISSNLGGPSEIITEGTGILIKQDNPQMLATKLSLLIDSKELRNEIGKSGYARFIRHFSQVIETNNIQKVYV